MPAADLQLGGGGEKIVIGQLRPVVENGDGEIKLRRERGDGLRDVAGTGDPQIHRRRNGFLIKPIAAVIIGNLRDGKIFFHAPAHGRGDGGKFLPKIFGFSRVRQNHAAHAAAADEAVVPAEIVVEHHFKFGGLAGFQGGERARLNLGFETAAAECANDFSVGEKNGLGPGALRAGTFGAGDERQRERLVRGGGKFFIKAGHAKVLPGYGNRFK